jgi:asparaginyl-tRNA synthetase
MQHILIKDIATYLGQEICLKGWVRNIRQSGKLVFIILRDGMREMQPYL